MNYSTDTENDSFDIEDSDDLIGVAKGLVNGRHPGILATVNEEGIPQLRWMSTLTFDEFPVFYSLTSPDSRKVAQIRARPDVNWLFFNDDQSLMLNLIGKARILTDAVNLKHIWQKVVDKSHAYFLHNYSKAPGFAVIETKVDTIECTMPQTCMRLSVQPADLVRAHYPI